MKQREVEDEPLTSRQHIVRLRARIRARPEGLADLHEAFERFFAQAEDQDSGVPTEDRVAIVTAAGELAANIIEHACKDMPEAEMSLVLRGHHDRIEVGFEDPGDAYTPPPMSDAEIELLPLGGMGMGLIHASVDELEYVRVRGTNQWRLVRKTGDPARTPRRTTFLGSSRCSRPSRRGARSGS